MPVIQQNRDWPASFQAAAITTGDAGEKFRTRFAKSPIFPFGGTNRRCLSTSPSYPKDSPLFELVEGHFDEFQGASDARFAAKAWLLSARYVLSLPKEALLPYTARFRRKLFSGPFFTFRLMAPYPFSRLAKLPCSGPAFAVRLPGAWKSKKPTAIDSFKAKNLCSSNRDSHPIFYRTLSLIVSIHSQGGVK